ncbi:MAG: DUF3291 domain-containing protein [Cocleimonas sp.]
MNTKFHLAQLNIADAKADQNSDIMSGFVDRLGEIHVLAEGSPGFIWRYQDEEGEEAPKVIFNNPLILVNMTLWQDIDSLRHFVYKTTHKELIQGREAWFHKMQEMHQVLWWVPEGHIPTLQEAKLRLDLIRQEGSTQKAFSFAKPYTPTS